MDIYDVPSLKNLLETHNFAFLKNMGQNFLVSEQTAEKITALSGANARTGVFEIGPGAGALTKKLCENSREVLAVELDLRLPKILEKTVPAQNLRLISADVLTLSESDINLAPPCVAVSNLPYNITAKATLFLLSLRKFSKITLTLQKEAARKVCSSPGDEGWCLFALLCAYYSERRFEFTIPAGSFYPRPGVDSAVVTLTPVPPPLSEKEEKIFFSLVESAFSSRRKTILNSFSPLFLSKNPQFLSDNSRFFSKNPQFLSDNSQFVSDNSQFISKTALLIALKACEIDPSARGEALPVNAFVRLASYLSSSPLKN